MNLTLPVSGAWRTTAIDLGQWLPGGSADGRNRRNLAVHQGVYEGRVAGPLRTFITVIPAGTTYPRQAA
jgi:hypothetical protein